MTAVYRNHVTEKQLPLLQLFFCLIRRRVPEERLGRLLEAGHIVDWGRIVWLAERHGVLPIVYVNIRQSGCWERLPPEGRARLRERYLWMTAESMRLRQGLVEIVDVLAGAGIEVVPFKGPLLGAMLYEDSLRRYCGDLDLLIPGSAVERAAEVLTAAGYRTDSVFMQKNRLARYAAFRKALEYVDESGRVKIDLHWRLSGNLVKPLDYDFLRRRLGRKGFYGRVLSCLSDEDMVVYLCLHGSYHLWPSLGSVLWVAEYIERRTDLDWERMLKLADALGGRRMLLWGLFMARDMFDVDLPATMVGCVEQDPVVAEMAGEVYADLFDDGGGPGRRHRGGSRIRRRFFEIPRHLKARQSPADKIRYLLWMGFCPSKREWLLLPLPARLFFLHFIFRPLRMVVEMIRARTRI